MARASVVCLHGLGRTPSDWDGVRDGLERFGPVRALLLPRDPAGALAAADAAIDPGDIVIGHSMGGVLALRLALERPRPLGAVVLTGCFFPPARNGRSLGATIADYAGHRLALLRDRERDAANARRRRGASRSLTTIVGLAVRQRSYRDALAAATTSVLIVHARDDHLVPVDFALAAAGETGWSIRVLAGGGHSAHVREPIPWLAAVTPWLEGVQAVGGGSFGSG